MIKVEVNGVQLGKADSMQEKNGTIKYSNFKIDKLRRSLFSIDWSAVGPVDLVHTPEKERFRVYPQGTTQKERAIIDAKISYRAKKRPGEIVLDWTTGHGRDKRTTVSIVFRIPDAPPPYVKSTKPKKSTSETPEKSKKQTNR
jgi:hypothetical protein